MSVDHDDAEPSARYRKRIQRALMELEGDVSNPLPAARLGALQAQAMDRYLGKALGMGSIERWYSLGPVEMELLVEALEERSAIVHDGPFKAKAKVA
jgi:hypothetical protein